MINTIGTTTFGTRTEEYQPYQYPKYTVTYSGVESDVRYSGSIYYNAGWKVTFNSGNPFTMVANLSSEVGTDGITPITTTGSYSTTNWSLDFVTTDKDIIHCDTSIVPFINQLTEYQVSCLDSAIASPPYCCSASGLSTASFATALSQAWPAFNTATGSLSGTAPPTFSDSYTAGDIVWRMAQMGWKQVPVVGATLKIHVTTNQGANITAYTSNLNRYYSKGSLQTAIGIPTNFYNAMAQDTDPSTSITMGITMYYGWLKQPPSIDQNGTNLTIQQEYKYALWPSNIFGTRL